jgi:hypothetical protein
MIALLIVGFVAFVAGLVVGIEATRSQVLDALRKVNEARSVADQETGRELIRTVERVTRGR